MNPKRVESLSINGLKKNLSLCQRLETLISENDKEPSWDGKILLYENEDFKKDNIISIPIQVKGTFVKDFNEHEIMHVASKIDLINYKNHNGVFYIVVQVNDTSDCKVFYKELLSTDINEILSQMGKQKTKKLTFKYFDMSSSENISSVLKSFHLDRLKHAPNDVYSHDLTKYRKIIMQFNAPKDKFENFLFDSRPLYGIMDTFPEKLVPITRAQPEKIALSVQCIVSIDGRQYYDIITQTRTKDSIIISIGKAFTLINKKMNGSREIKFNIQLIGTFKERYQDSVFVKELLEKTHYEVNNKQIHLPIEKEKTTDILNLIDILDDINMLYAVLGIKDDLIIDKLNAQETIMLNRLVGYFVNGDKNAINITETGILTIQISNLTLKFLGIKHQDGTTELIDLFSDKRRTNATFIFESDGVQQTEEYSICLTLKMTDFLEISNLDYNQVYADVFERGIEYNPRFEELAVFLLLEVLKAYDVSNNSELMTLAERIDDFLMSKSNSNPYILINHLQLQKRKRPLNKLENTDLMKLKMSIETKSDKQDILFAVNVLMGHRLEADYWFEQLSIEKAEEMQGYPIYNLYKTMP